MKYEYSDAWVLLAVIYSGKDKGASIAEIVAAADFIEHAILTYEEMNAALSLLSKGDYLWGRCCLLELIQRTIGIMWKI